MTDPQKLLPQVRKPIALVTVLLAFFSGSCLSSREADTHYGASVPPSTQELRWSDGGLPRSFDPAQAAAAPETDVVRALFEGLTDYDPQTLSTLPAAALSWESSADHREWTFRLRRDAHWTNGDAVTSGDFVRSWQRALKQGEKTPHADLLRNIEGASESPTQTSGSSGSSSATRDRSLALNKAQGRDSTFGVQSVDDYTLRVRLARSNPHFPDLVAHPVFRPIHQNNSDGDFNEQSTGRIISNGAFQLLEATPGQVTLDRSKSYWDVSRVALDRVKFVQTVDNERALSLYRAGKIDAVSNANLEPLAVKLLTPYQDFRRRTFGALVYYSFNMRHPALADRRVREALALAVNRQRLCTDIMDGATEPAEDFLPDWSGEEATEKEVPPPLLRYDPERAKRLMTEAGYDNGHGFPRIRLLVNRNDQQRAVAVAVAEMWQATLGVETEIDVRPWEQYVIAIRAGDYDVARRSLVLQTTDEATNFSEMFAPQVMRELTDDELREDQALLMSTNVELLNRDLPLIPEQRFTTPQVLITSKAQALSMLPAAPIYFSSSFSLVKPYVQGFNSNLLDAPSLKHVRIDRGT